MPKDKSGTRSEAAVCGYCDPVQAVQHELGSGIGADRHRHYLGFASTSDLEKHLREVAWFPKPISGLDFDSWLSSVLTWHQQQRAQKAEDERRWAGLKRGKA